MMIVAFDENRDWYVQGHVFEDIIESVPAGMLEDDDLVMHLRPARAMGLLDLHGMDPDRARRIVAALSEGVVGRMRTIDQSNNELVEFYKGLLETAAGRVVNDRLTAASVISGRRWLPAIDGLAESRAASCALVGRSVGN